MDWNVTLLFFDSIKNVVFVWLGLWVVADLGVLVYSMFLKKNWRNRITRKSLWKTELVNGILSGILTSVLVLVF